MVDYGYSSSSDVSKAEEESKDEIEQAPKIVAHPRIPPQNM